jgi:hypothetical protein
LTADVHVHVHVQVQVQVHVHVHVHVHMHVHVRCYPYTDLPHTPSTQARQARRPSQAPLVWS